jgi:hypothetical protein
VNQPGVILLVIVAVAVIIALVVLQSIQAKKRRQALEALARELGWEFEPDKDYSPTDGQAAYRIFNRGDDRYAYDMLRGNVEIDGRLCAAAMGDYHYEETHGSGKDRHTTNYYFSYVLLRLPWTTPDLLIRPEGFFDKVAGALGFEDINFESAEFSRRFHVASADKRFAYDVIDPRMMEWLLAIKPLPLDVHAGLLCVAHGSGTWSPEEFRARLNYAVQFLTRWPEHVKTTLRGGVTSR